MNITDFSIIILAIGVILNSVAIILLEHKKQNKKKVR